MTTRAASSENATERLTAELRTAILRGEYPAGAKLPPERDLAERYGVHRVTVRGALARLSSMRLVAIRHGSGCVVQDYRRSAGLELAGALLEATRDGKAEASEIVEDLLAVRRAIARVALERLAARVDERRIAQITAAVDALERRVEEGADRAAIAEADVEVFATIVAATGSTVLQLCVNPVSQVLASIPGLRDAIYAEPHANVLSYRLLLAWLPTRRTDMIAPILAALEAHDRAALKAHRRARR